MGKKSFVIEKVDGVEYLLKIQGVNWELNIRLSDIEFGKLKNISSANWEMRKSIKAGISAETPVFWSYWEEEEQVSIVVGNDDETWDFGVFIPVSIVDEIINSSETFAE